MHIANDSILSGNIDLASDWISMAIPVGRVEHYAIQLIFNGVPSGSFKLQCSVDKGHDVFSKSQSASNVSNWTDIPGSEQIVSVAGDHVWAAQNSGYQWARIVWTSTLGIGFLTSARFATKGY